MYRAMSRLYIGPGLSPGPPDMFKLVQLGPNSEGTPPDTFHLFTMKHRLLESGQLAFN